MKFVGRIAILSSFFLVIAAPSFATSLPWGTGAWGGMQACPYPHSSGENASLYEDQIAETRESISEMRRQLSAKKSEKRKLDRIDVKRSSDRIDRYFAGEYSDFIKQHIENSKVCANYKGMRSPEQTQIGGTEGGDEVSPTSQEEVTGFQLAEWARACDGTRPGSVSPAVCDVPKYKSPDNKRFTAVECKKSLSDYRRDYAKSMKLQQEIEALEDGIRSANESIKETSQIAREELREQQREQMEGGICIGCAVQGGGYQYQKREPDWANVAVNAGAGVLATLLGYQSNKMVADRNAQLGWPTQSYPAWGYGFPFLMNAAYGAIGGGVGQGAFGCAGGMGGAGFGNGPMGMMGPFGMGSMYPGYNGGAFGYPGMGTPGFGGGMYPGGMGPWGGAGPWGIGGPTAGGMGYPMVGVGGGFPMGGGMVGGVGGAMGFPMGGGMGGYPAAGGMVGGLAGGVGGAMGYPAMGGMDGGLGAIQMQQQMMEMQMRQYQMVIEQQKRAQEDALNRQRVSAGIQQEIYGLYYRLQQVQMGYGSSGYLGGSSGGGVLGGTGTTGSGVIPGGSGIIPGGATGGSATTPLGPIPGGR